MESAQKNVKGKSISRKTAKQVGIKRIQILRQGRKKRSTGALAENGTLAEHGRQRARNGAEDVKNSLMSVCRQRCMALGIPLTQSLMSNVLAFYDQRLQKLEYLNEQMIYVYASAFIYRHAQGLRKKVLAKGIKKEIFGNALSEVDDWTRAQETVEDGEIVCNLYSIVGEACFQAYC